ncbi:MAG: STAS domain-containing protein [Rhodocyclales bacterium]|nr:STAS domain-containing protein [Rhodocyclales bacterium]
MLERSGSALKVTTAMLYGNASALLASGRAALDAGVTEVDLGAVSDADSSALAVLFAWLRDGRSRNVSLRIVNPPAGLLSLAGLYGVDDFLPLA